MIGGNVDLDLLSLFPQEGARIIGGIERKQSSRKVNNGGERAAKRLENRWGRRPPFIAPTKSNRYSRFCTAVVQPLEAPVQLVFTGSHCRNAQAVQPVEPPVVPVDRSQLGTTAPPPPNNRLSYRRGSPHSGSWGSGCAGTTARPAFLWWRDRKSVV